MAATAMNGTPHAPGAGRRWAVLAICALALFLVGLDTTIVAVGLPEIGRGIGADTDRLAWVVDAYTVPFASLLITSGALADRFGRRRVFRIGLVVFGVSSLACALAPSLALLIAARAAQGVGASMLTPVALAIVVNAMPDPRERARAIGVWGAMFGLSLAAGPVSGGALIAAFDWRALFWINAPVVLLALVLTALVVPESRSATPRRLDPIGQLLLATGLAVGVAALIEGSRLGWGSPPLIGAYALVLLAFAGFARVESSRREPLIDPGLFRVPSFAGAIVGALAVFVAFSATLLLTASVLQHAQGWSPLAAGAATLPMAVTATACAPLSGFLVGRIGPRTPLFVAGACLLVGAALTAGAGLRLGADSGGFLPLLLSAYLVLGAGIGFANAPITTAAVSGLPPERAGVAGGTASTARQVGTAVGAALAGGLASAGFSMGLPVIVALCGAAVLVCAGAAPGSVRSGPGSAAPRDASTAARLG